MYSGHLWVVWACFKHVVFLKSSWFGCCLLLFRRKSWSASGSRPSTCLPCPPAQHDEGFLGSERSFPNRASWKSSGTLEGHLKNSRPIFWGWNPEDLCPKLWVKAGFCSCHSGVSDRFKQSKYDIFLHKIMLSTNHLSDFTTELFCGVGSTKGIMEHRECTVGKLMDSHLLVTNIAKQHVDWHAHMYKHVNLLEYELNTSSDQHTQSIQNVEKSSYFVSGCWTTMKPLNLHDTSAVPHIYLSSTVWYFPMRSFMPKLVPHKPQLLFAIFQKLINIQVAWEKTS